MADIGQASCYKKEYVHCNIIDKKLTLTDDYKDKFIIKLGIIAPIGKRFTLSGQGTGDLIIGATGIYELDNCRITSSNLKIFDIDKDKDNVIIDMILE